MKILFEDRWGLSGELEGIIKGIQEILPGLSILDFFNKEVVRIYDLSGVMIMNRNEKIVTWMMISMILCQTVWADSNLPVYERDSLKSINIYKNGSRFFQQLKISEADSCFSIALTLDSNNYWAKFWSIYIQDSKRSAGTNDGRIISMQYLQIIEQYSNLINKINLSKKRALEADTLLAEIFFQRAWSSQPYPFDAIKDLDSAIQLNSSKAQYYAQRAYYYQQIKHKERAIKDLDTAIILNPGQLLYHLDRSDLLFETGDYLGSAQDITIAMGLPEEKLSKSELRQVDTTYHSTIYTYIRGRAYYFAGLYSEALNDFLYYKSAERRIYNPTELNYFIGLCYLGLGDTAKAEGIWQNAMKSAIEITPEIAKKERFIDRSIFLYDMDEEKSYFFIQDELKKLKK